MSVSGTRNARLHMNVQDSGRSTMFGFLVAHKYVNRKQLFQVLHRLITATSLKNTVCWCISMFLPIKLMSSAAQQQVARRGQSQNNNKK